MGNVSLQLLFLIFLSKLSYFDTIKLGFCRDDLKVSCIAIEKKALLEFKSSLSDPSGRLSSWIGEDCCRWRGVNCSNETKNVIRLNLRNSFSNDLDRDTSALGGKISSSLLDLKYLSYLDLSMNNFGGTEIPNFFGSLKILRYLNLSGASFGGSIPQNLRNLSNLQYLDLNSYNDESVENNLRWVSGLWSLKYLNLGNLDLSGAASYWLQAINTLPSLLELHLPQCQLLNLPTSLPFVNFTSLSVLDISNNGFNSTIPQWLYNLSSLTQLDLSTNSLQGVIPDAFSELSALEKLDLSSNYGIGGKLSRRLGKLCNLKMLALNYNNLTGSIADFIDSLSECSHNSLETLDLGYNELTGNLPNSLGFLKNLQYLRLRQNLFTGPIPETIGNLSSLQELYLSNNQMSGKITKNLGQLSSLAALDLSENPWEGIITEAHLMNLSSLKELSMGIKLSNKISLAFNISSGWIPPFTLRFITIQSCKLGPEFPKWLKNQTELTSVIFNTAQISDTIPDWFVKLNLQLDELDVAYNELRGNVPNSLRFTYLSNVDLSSNRFEGPLALWSSNVSTLYLRDNLFSGPIPPDIGMEMPYLTDLDISRNFLDGSIPMSLGNLTGLTTLVISSNHLSGKIPQIWDKMPLLYLVDMSNNTLFGTIPSSIGSLTFLRFLMLSGNNLSGELPSSLRNCTELDSLDVGDNQLSGNLPAWIGESMPSLLILRLRNNSLTGNIPLQLCSLSILHILDLAKNNLSGPIPPCIGNLTGFKMEFTSEDVAQYQGRLEVVAKGRILQYYTTLYLFNSIDLSRNNLSGEIPANITSLFRLGTLNLSMNHLTGKIPADIGSLKLLETLDFSINQLSGPIPTSMALLTSLNHLNLSYNNLSGMIPTSTQLQSISDPSIYAGNAALCGSPLLTKCANETTFTGRDGDRDDDNEPQKLKFIIVIGLGFFSGFWGVCGTLIIKQHWRYAFFHFLERMKERMC